MAYDEHWKVELELFLEAQEEWNDRWSYDDDWDYWHYWPRETKRDRRIRDRMRMIARGRNYRLREISYWWGSPDFKHRYHIAEMYGRYHYDHLHVCSCNGCGNPRHDEWTRGQDKLTLQERRAGHKPKHKNNLKKELDI